AAKEGLAHDTSVDWFPEGDDPPGEPADRGRRGGGPDEGAAAAVAGSPEGAAHAARGDGAVARPADARCAFCGRSLRFLSRFRPVRRRAVARREPAGEVQRRSPRVPKAPAGTR